MFSLLECIGFKNIHMHLGIFTANLSKVSELFLTNKIMIRESGIMDEQHQNKVYRLPPFFLPQATLGLSCLLIFLSPRSTWVPACRLAVPTFPYWFQTDGDWIIMNPCITVHGIIYLKTTDLSEQIQALLLKPQVWC